MCGHMVRKAGILVLEPGGLVQGIHRYEFVFRWYELTRLGRQRDRQREREKERKRESEKDRETERERQTERMRVRDRRRE